MGFLSIRNIIKDSSDEQCHLRILFYTCIPPFISSSVSFHRRLPSHRQKPPFFIARSFMQQVLEHVIDAHTGLRASLEVGGVILDGEFHTLFILRERKWDWE